VGGVPFFLWGAILLVYGSIDIVMLQTMTNSDVVGWYGLAYRWVGIPVVVPGIIAAVMLPSLSSLALVDTSQYTRLVNRAIQIVMFAALPMAAGIALVTGNIIHLLHYPPGFGHSVLLTQILAVHIPIVAMDMMLAIALTAKDRQKAWLVVGCVAAVFNPLLNLIAIPLTTHRFGDGAIGASVVTVATELVMMIGAIILRPAGVLDRPTVSFILRCAGATAIMIPAVLFAAGLPLALKVLIGVVTFACGALAFRVLTLREAWNLFLRGSQSLRNRLGGTGVPVATN
jgi:O-antigen/teichoic acid export membrane protein